MPYVPPNLNPIVDFFYRPIDLAINLLLAIGPKLLPREYFRVIQKQAPERNEVAIGRTLITPRCAHELIQFNQPQPRSFDRDAAFSSNLATMLAETRDLGASIEPSVTRSDRIV